MMLNMKGGVAKTTNTVALAECLAEQGKKVLVIDADHQCMSSELLIGEDRLLRCEKQTRTLHDLLATMLDDEFEADRITPFVVERTSNIGDGYPNLHLIPCSIRIDDFATNMAKARRGHLTIAEWVTELDKKRRVLSRYFADHYDMVLIDCPPSFSVTVQQFLRIAEGYVIPSVPDHLSVRGSRWLLDRLRRGRYTRITGVGTLWSLYRQQAATHREIIEAVRSGHADYEELPRPFNTIIPNASKISESTEPNIAPASFSAKYSPKFARLYEALSQELLDRVHALGL
jgi:chromosome partitioning protein